MAVVFAERVKDMKASEIRELLKLAEREDMISFAGGAPAPELFPVEEIKKITVKILEESGSQALQYACTEGYHPLRRKVAQWMNTRFHTSHTIDNILITSGSQQGLDITGKLFLNENDVVLCESPTYLGAIQAFSAYRARMVEVPSDEHGMIIPELEQILSTLGKVKFIYVNPDFQNPTGRTWSLERRKQFMEVISAYEVPVLEDNPYGELRFEGERLPAMQSLDTKGLVIFLGTFSKVFCPGLRIGWVAAPEAILEKYVLAKQGADLHTSSISQRKVAEYMECYNMNGNIKKLVEVYRRRRDVMLESMQKEFPEGMRWNKPEGGLFIWAELPENVQAAQVLEESLKRNVAFVAGGCFYPGGGHGNTLRLNFSNASEEKIVEGIRRLGGVIREFMQS